MAAYPLERMAGSTRDRACPHCNVSGVITVHRKFPPDHLLAEEQVSGSPLVAGNEVTLLSDGPATYEAMLDAIHNARALILLESYILDNDAIGAKFAEALTERCKAGVTVALMVDSVGTLSTPDAYFDALQQAGVVVVHFNSLNPVKSSFGWNINERDHRKVLVVDGNIAFTGGLNLSEVYSSRPGRSGARSRQMADKDAPWRDTHVRIRGPAAMDLQREFLEGWAEQGGPPLFAAGKLAALAKVRSNASAGQRSRAHRRDQSRRRQHHLLDPARRHRARTAIRAYNNGIFRPQSRISRCAGGCGAAGH